MDAAGKTPDDLNRFVSAVRKDLEAIGFHDSALRLAGIQGAAFTTGSEWLGELGAAVNEILSAHDETLPTDLRTRLGAILGRARQVWPAL
jgi:hypothetical protein